MQAGGAVSARGRIVCAVAASVAVAVAAAGPAAAAPKKAPPSDRMTASVGASVSLAGSTATVEAELLDSFASAASASSCREATWEVYGKNLLGWKLWSYYRWIRWCWSGGLLTSVSRNRWGQTHMVGWAWKGHLGQTASGGVGKSSYRTWTQGHFCLVEYFSCIQNVYPWMDVTVNAGGGWSWRYG